MTSAELSFLCRCSRLQQREMISSRSCVILLLLAVAVAAVLPSYRNSPHRSRPNDVDCGPNASWTILESIPLDMGVNVTTFNISTADGWVQLFNGAQQSIDIAAYYFLLTSGNDSMGGQAGKDVFESLVNAGKRGVKIRIVQNLPSDTFPDNDSRALADMGLAEVRSINWTALMQDGILHTKMFVVDYTDVYIGSANMDWTSLTQVKELGMLIRNCVSLAKDANKIFEMYYWAANATSVPTTWPSYLDTNYNDHNFLNTTLNGAAVSSFIASSPNSFCTPARTHDDAAIIDAIQKANSSVCIEVMDYFPCTLYFFPSTLNYWWPNVDDALRAAAFRGVQVRLMTGHWAYTIPSMYQYLASLNQLTNVQVKLYTVPPVENQVPYTRVNHAKFMVTDRQIYIGTSNWSGDYFVYTGGVSYSAVSEPMRTQLQDIFNRDWDSPFATFVNNTNVNFAPFDSQTISKFLSQDPRMIYTR